MSKHTTPRPSVVRSMAAALDAAFARAEATGEHQTVTYPASRAAEWYDAENAVNDVPRPWLRKVRAIHNGATVTVVIDVLDSHRKAKGL
jgi:hypothetical protein